MIRERARALSPYLKIIGAQLIVCTLVMGGAAFLFVILSLIIHGYVRW